MPTSFWLRRFLIVFAGAFVILCLAQRLREHSWNDAAVHGVVWGVVSSALYTVAQIYHTRRGRTCALCDDLPAAHSGRGPADG